MQQYEAAHRQDDTFAQEPELQRRMAQAYFQFARSLSNAQTEQDRQQCLNRFGQAIGMLTTLAAEYPENPWYRHDLRVLKCRGIAYAAMTHPGHLQEAERDHNESLRVFERFPRIFPTTRGGIMRQSISNSKLPL